MNDDQRLLASAALDGDVTDAERARAEADPEVVAEIARLREARDATRAVGPSDAARREAAIAAALAAFDRRAGALPPGAVVAPLPPSRSRRGHRWLAPLAAAAAVAVIAVGGIVATRGDGEGDDSSASDLATAVADTDAGATTDQALSAAPAPAEADAEAGVDASDASDDGAAEAGPGATGDTAVDAPAQAPTSAAAPLGSPEELAAFATSAGRLAAGAPATCAGGTFVGAASYLVDDEAVAVEVFEVDAPHQAVARRLDDCRIVARAPLP